MLSISSRINGSSYYLSDIQELKKRAYANNKDVIDLGMGNPDIPTFPPIITRLCDTVKNHASTHKYPQVRGLEKFRKSVVKWIERRFGYQLDYKKEVLTLIGSKEGIVHLCMAYLDVGDVALVCNPAYPVYVHGVKIAGGRIFDIPLLKKNGYLPDLQAIPEKVARQAKMFILGYPHNPTAAIVKDHDFFKSLIRFAKKYDILIVYDNAYSEITFGDYVAPSFLQFEGAKDVGVEFFSFSKTYNMAGWRIGFVIGRDAFIQPLEKIKSFLDYGVPTFIQLAAIQALDPSIDTYIQKSNQTYKKRGDFLSAGLSKLKWEVEPSDATLYLWAKVPDFLCQEGSFEFCKKLILDTGIVLCPGIGFGTYGENHVRIALVTHSDRFHDMLLRLKSWTRNQVVKS